MPSRAKKEVGDSASKLRVGDAGAKGKGVYAARPIELGEQVWDYTGDEKLVKSIPPGLLQYCFQVDHDRYAVPKEGSAGWFMNHSCAPNCVVMGRTRIVALRRINSGEEVTFDYSTNVGRDGFSMECICGTKECRKVVRSYGFLPDELKGHYGACVSGFLLRPTAPSGARK